MPEKIRKILSEIQARLKRLYGERLKGVYLYGSYARSDYEDGSDLDILVILDTFRFHNTEISRTADLVSDLSLKYSITISPMFIRERDWMLTRKPLIRNVKREGVKIYERRKQPVVAQSGRSH
ncbi:MAG: nucleotidyltransferase domain-containing protein [Chloroflexi bacterium]|nr:nucleotidyltransferase domain-containing protein [Chloroflexota bacterium]